VDLRNALAARFSVELPATAVYDYPTPAALAAHIAKLLAAKQPAQESGGHDTLDMPV
jgi:Phosphopantetheine attachment site